MNPSSKYEDYARRVLKHGKPSTDRTGTGTLRVTGDQIRFSLADGCPIVTTKQVSIGFVAKELEWILKGNTSQKYLKEKLKCSIWDEWADEHGRLGPVYGAMWMRRPASHIEIQKKPLDMRVGVMLDSDRAAKLTQVNLRKHGRTQLNNNPAFAVWKRILLTVANSPTTITNSVPETFQTRTLDARWMKFENFEEDFYSLPGCEITANADRDCYFVTTSNLGYGIYAPDTVSFVETYKQIFTTMAHQRTIAELHDSGEHQNVFVPRYYINQLQEAIDTLRTNPDSRRIIVDSWEPALLPVPGVAPDKQAALGKMALAPCHCMFQFTAIPDGKGGHTLDLHLLQRSVDTALGAPYNHVSYAILLEVVAREVGMTAGDFIWTGVDCHVYKNHVQTLRKQLRRKTHPLPKLVIDPSVKGISTFSWDKVKLENYVHGPKTDYPVAI